VVDGRGRLALPGFVNAHAHVDKSWLGHPWQPFAGEATTQGRIAHERAERDRLGIPSVETAARVLRELLRYGTTAIRTHVDVDLGVGIDGIGMVREAAEGLGGAVAVEVVAFPQDGVIRRGGVLDLLEQAARAGADGIGGLDPSAIDRDPVAQLDGLFAIAERYGCGLDPSAIDRDPVAQLDGLFAIAERYGCGLDIHLHSRGELGAFEFELIAERTRRAGLQGRVNVSHGFALGQLPLDRQAAVLDQLGDAGISWATVAPIGSAPLPWRAMLDRGIAIGLGTDGIRDLWSPYGTGDLLRVALDFARLHGLRHDEDLVEVARLATSAGGRFVSRPVHDLVVGAPADVVLLDAENVPDAVVRAPDRALVVAGGQVVVEDGQVLR